jgi:ABC-type multidrug transport system fused ATPase/permease subunit
MIQNLIKNISISVGLSTPQVRVSLVVASILGISAAFIELVFIQALQNFLTISKILPISSGYDGLSAFSTLPSSIFLILLLALARAVIEGLKIYISRNTMLLFSTSLRGKVLKYVFSSELVTSSQSAVAIFNDDVARSSTALLNLSSLLIYFFTGLFMLFFLMSISPVDFAIAITIISFFQYPLTYIGRTSKRVGENIVSDWESINQTLTQGLRNSFYLKIYGQIENEKNKALSLINQYLTRYQEAFKIISLKLGIPSFLGILVIIILIIVRENFNVEIPSHKTIAFIYLFIRFAQNLSLLMGIISDFNINMESSKKVDAWISKQYVDEMELLKARSRILSKSKEVEFKSEIHSLKVRNLNFGYGNERFLKGINFEIGSKDSLVITGSSGSGKSTLLSLVLGMNLTDENQILINDLPLNSIIKDKASYQYFLNQIAYVGPYPYLIEGTVLDNLLYAINRTKVDKEKISQALKMSCFAEVVNLLPQGLDTKLNEQASILSVGQKQRLMIARSILRNPRLLIMDEATSNLDDETEQTLLRELSKWLEDRMAIIVTHKKGPKTLGKKFLHLISSNSKIEEKT